MAGASAPARKSAWRGRQGTLRQALTITKCSAAQVMEWTTDYESYW
jgi:hypothetical protein